MSEDTKDKTNKEEELEEFGFEEESNAQNIVDNKDSKQSFLVSLAIFVGMSIVVLSYSLYTTYEFATDNSVPLVVCPRDYTLDAPVIMKRMDDNKSYVHERWIRGFIRRYATKLFPRTKEDTQPFFQYIADHSKGGLQDEYLARLEDIEAIASAIESKQYISMYAKDGGLKMRIRPQTESLSGYKTWVVELDAYLIINDGLRQKRDTPVLRFVVEAGKPTLTNPEGLYVSEFETNYTTDYVSGNKLEEQEEEDEN